MDGADEKPINKHYVIKTLFSAVTLGLVAWLFLWMLPQPVPPGVDHIENRLVRDKEDQRRTEHELQQKDEEARRALQRHFEENGIKIESSVDPIGKEVSK